MSVREHGHHATHARTRGTVRRRAQSRGASGAIGLNLTPMIDVVFQLLVYFLLGTSFALGEEIYRMDLPRPRAAGSIAPDDPVVVSVRSLGDGRSAYALDAGPAWPALADSRALAAALRGAILSPSNPRGTLTLRNPIVIAPEADARWEHAVDAFDAAVGEGFERVSFAPLDDRARPGP